MRPLTYSEFFRLFVQRKRQELLNPKFIGIGEVTLPMLSVLHYFPKEGGDIGPDRAEGFVSNFHGDVFVDFSAEMVPVIGHGKFEVLDKRKTIQNYRASHYQYNWTRDINTVWRKKDNLVVNSYGLALKPWTPRASIFVNFESHYNRYTMLMNSINTLHARDPEREQFMRVDLPVNMPGWSKVLETLDHYIRNFKDGKPVASNQTVQAVKAESSYWLIDLVAFLLGDYGYSLFNNVSPEAMTKLHVMFVYNSRCLVVNLNMWKGWLDELVKKNEKDGIEGKSSRENHPQRLNAVKRIYLALLNLTRDGVPEEQVVKEEKAIENGQSGKTTSPNAPVAEGQEGSQKGQGSPSPVRGQGSSSGKNETVATPAPVRDLADVFSSPKGTDRKPVEDEGRKGSSDLPEDPEDWTAPVDDALLEVEQVSTALSVAKDPFHSPESGVILALEERAREGGLTVAEQAFFMRKASQFKHIELENGQTLEEFIRVDAPLLESLKDDSKLAGTYNAISDPSMLQSRAKVLKQGYVDKILHKDIASMFLGVQNAGIALNDFQHEVISGVEGIYDTYKVQLHEVNGDQNTIALRLPKVGKDGAFVVDGVKTHLQLQRMELPIRKINKFKVALTSHYDRKLMVQRSQYRSDDPAEWYARQIIEKGKTKYLTFNRGKTYDPKLKAPRIYSILSSQFQWIETPDVKLDLRFDKLIADYPDFKKFNKLNSFLIGVKDNKPVTIDSYGVVFVDGVELNTLDGLLQVNISKMPLEPAMINIGNYLFPIVVPLCYYFGLDDLIRVTKATTRSVPMGTRPKLAPDEYAVAFNDEYLIFSRREKVPSMIFSGLVKLNNISNFSRSDLNDKNIWGPLMADPKVRATQFREMKNLYDLFIDPVTKTQLKRMGYADSFHYLLLDAVKLLETDYTRSGVELEEQRIVGYERFAGHVYRELVKSIRAYRNKGVGRKHKIDFNPEAVIQAILKDTSVNAVEEVNPVHQMKDQEELTFGGVGGQSEIAMTKRSRTQKDSYRGVVSDANKDSGKVGFVTFTTSDPLIADYRGNINIGEEPSDTSLLSVTGNLAFSITSDDTKRVSFLSTQWSQAVSAATYSHNICRTGSELTAAHRVSELYSKVAKENGKVTSIKDHVMTVMYDDGTTDKYPLGLKIGEASGEYHRHTRVTDLKEGDTFNKGDVIGWNEAWFMRCAFNPGQVALLTGRQVRVALVEDQDTYEDSTAISRVLADEMITPYLKPKRFAIDVDKRLSMKVKVGDEVDYDGILCEIEDDLLPEEGETSSLVGDINRLGIKQHRAPVHGKVIRIEVTYNADKAEMTPSLQKLVEACDKQKKLEADASGDPVTEGKVSKTLNVSRPLLSPGKALVVVYIESLDRCTTSDKFVLGNQMKGTASTIMPYVLKTKDGRVVDLKNSFKGLLNRMVLSLRNKLAGNELSIHFTQLAVKAYRGTK